MKTIKTVTTLFTDIQSYAAFCEKLTLTEIFDFLNEYMTLMVECVSSSSGSVNKFIGDAVMALWGTPDSSGDIQQDACNAVRAALLMRETLKKFNSGRGAENKPIVKTSCGINTGEVMAGTIGPEAKNEYTVIGDNVNLAAYACSNCKKNDTGIIITENTWLLVKDSFVTEELPQMDIRGRLVRIFSVISLLPREQTLCTASGS